MIQRLRYLKNKIVRVELCLAPYGCNLIKMNICSYKHAKVNRNKIFLFLVVFLSGCKADEYLNVKKNPDLIQRLEEGNKRFIQGKFQNNRSPKLLEDLSKGQHPYAVVISCSDSRISPNVLFDTDLGDLFIIRTAGNVLDEVGLASIEYAVEHLNTKLVVIMGHKNCGVIQSYMHDEHPNNHIQSVINIIRDEPEEKALRAMHDNNCVHYELANVEHQYNYIITNSKLAKERLDKGQLKIAKAYLNTVNGKIEFLK